MNDYEGMFIFPDTVREEALDEATAKIRADVEKFGGKVEAFTRIGQRTFARPLRKRKSGHYIVSRFQMDGASIPQLKERLKLAGEVFRAQILRASAPKAAAAEKTESDAVAQ